MKRGCQRVVGWFQSFSRINSSAWRRLFWYRGLMGGLTLFPLPSQPFLPTTFDQPWHDVLSNTIQIFRIFRHH